jgi:hypothetical protein
MPVQLPLFLLPAFAGVPATPPEQLALMRARQRMDKLLARVGAMASGLMRIDAESLATTLAEATRTLRAIDHALDKIEQYEDVRPRPRDKAEMERFRTIAESVEDRVSE